MTIARKAAEREAVAELRDAGYTQEQITAVTGIPQRTVSDYDSFSGNAISGISAKTIVTATKGNLMNGKTSWMEV